MSEDKTYQPFLSLIETSKRGKLKIYIGMSAGVGKTYKMLQEAHALLQKGIDVKIGFIETHHRPDTHQLLGNLPRIPQKEIFYKGKLLKEMDTQAIIQQHPAIVIVDELAHSNIPGSKNEKRWQDVMEILNAGINVISAVNIQHIESLQSQIKTITTVEVQERVPDQILAEADEIVNIDLTADELIQRLKAGKIYTSDKIALALQNFFKEEHILQLRELALKEVALYVEKKVKTAYHNPTNNPHEHLLVCISSNASKAENIIRKAARIAGAYQSTWAVLYVQTPAESSQQIALEKQKKLIFNLNLAKSLGAEIVKLKQNTVWEGIEVELKRRKTSIICMGKPDFSFWNTSVSKNLFLKINALSTQHTFQLIIIPNS